MARSTPKIIVMPAATSAYIDPVMMPLTICSRMKELTMCSQLGCGSLGRVVDLGGNRSLDGRLAVGDLQQHHRHHGLVVVVEGHDAHRAVVLDPGQRIADGLALHAVG